MIDPTEHTSRAASQDYLAHLQPALISRQEHRSFYMVLMQNGLDKRWCLSLEEAQIAFESSFWASQLKLSRAQEEHRKILEHNK